MSSEIIISRLMSRVDNWKQYEKWLLSQHPLLGVIHIKILAYFVVL
jgi:hypothetical protein